MTSAVLAYAEDDDFIAACLAGGLRTQTPPPPCSWCAHTEHGLACSDSRCECESSFTSRDDCWRPRALTTASRLARLMDLHGVDGWTARLVMTFDRKLGPLHGLRLRTYLEGEDA